MTNKDRKAVGRNNFLRTKATSYLPNGIQLQGSEALHIPNTTLLNSNINHNTSYIKPKIHVCGL